MSKKREMDRLKAEYDKLTGLMNDPADVNLNEMKSRSQVLGQLHGQELQHPDKDQLG